MCPKRLEAYCHSACPTGDLVTVQHKKFMLSNMAFALILCSFHFYRFHSISYVRIKISWWQYECLFTVTKFYEKFLLLVFVNCTVAIDTKTRVWLNQLPCLTWGIVFSDFHIVNRTFWTGLQAEVYIAESEVVSCGPLKIPLTTGTVRITWSWKARAMNYTPLTNVATATCFCEERQNKHKAIWDCSFSILWSCFKYIILIF